MILHKYIILLDIAKMWLSSLIFSPECFRLDSYIKIFTNNLKTENSLKTGGINAWYFLNVSFQIISQCSCKLLRKPIIDALFCCLFCFILCSGTHGFYHILWFQFIAAIILFDAQGIYLVNYSDSWFLFLWWISRF